MKIRTFYHRNLLGVLMLAVMVSCIRPEQKVVIVSTNDMHASIDNFPHLATLVEQLRVENGQVFLVDAGDRWTGNPYVDRAGRQYSPIIELMNELGYDIATHGNHEWDSGIDTLAARMHEARFAQVLANADMSMTPMPPTESYLSVSHNADDAVKGGHPLSAAYLGYVTTAVNGHPDGFLYNFGGTEFSNFLDVAPLYAHLGNDYGLYVVISHLGLEADSILAVHHPEIDLIIGGHSHDLLPVGKKINNTVITQTGSRLRYAGVTTVTYRGKKLTGIENHVVKLDTIAPSPRFAAMVERYNDDPVLGQAVGKLSAYLDETALMNLFSDILRIETKADFAFYNMGGMRLDSLVAGDVSYGDLYAAEPFNNKPVVLEMTMDDIASLLLNKFNSKGNESHSLDLYPSGVTYRVVTDAEGNGTDVFFDHKFYPEQGKKYKVALSDYVVSVYDFPQRGQGISGEDPIAELAINYVKKNTPLQADNTLRVVIE